MTQTLLIKRSAVAAKIPLVTDLVLGELGINTNDGKIFLKKNDGADSIVEIGANIFTGDVTGSGNGAVALTLANSGAIASTYKSVTVDAKGRVTAGTNPTTLAEYGITDAPTKSGTGATGTWPVSITGNAVTVTSITSGQVTTALGFTPSNSADAGVANGYATLDTTGKIITSQLPALAITDTFVVATQAAMLALTAQTGDVAVRTDLNKSLILKGTTSSVLEDWQELLTPTDTILSVNGQTGSVTLTTTNINEGTNLYYTAVRASADAPVQSVVGRTGTVTLSVADVSDAAPINDPIFTGIPTAPTATVGTDTAQLATTAFVIANDDPAKANLASPALTGTPTAPTPATATNTTQLATTAYVQANTALQVAKTGDTLTGPLNGTFFNGSVATGVVAAGTTQATATNITASIVIVSTATADQGIELPTAVPGMFVTVINTTAVTIKVYPATGAQVDSLGANIAYSLGAGAKLEYVASTSTQWYSLTGVYA